VYPKFIEPVVTLPGTAVVVVVVVDVAEYIGLLGQSKAVALIDITFCKFLLLGVV
jgi:hypothetical protein